jgi:hypothetical protein
MGRKTIEVCDVLESANKFLAAKDSTPDGREAVLNMLESILFATGNYDGFRYLELEMHEDGSVLTLGSGSRREYFMKTTL